MRRIEGQIKKQQRDRMFQEKMIQTLDETDLKEIMTELMCERQEEPKGPVDSNYEVKQEPVPSLDDDLDNRQFGESTFNSGMQYYKSGVDTGNNSINPTYYQTLNPELSPDVSFATYVKAKQEAILQQEMENDMMYKKSNAKPKVLQPRHTRYNDANTIFVYGCSDCPFMRKKAFENKILVTCHFNPEQEFILEQGHSADELDNLMRNNCQLRKLIEINIRLT